MPTTFVCVIFRRAAMNAQLWPLALLISKLLGASYTSDCVTRYVNSTLSTSSPLRTLCLLAGGAAQAVSQTNEQQQLVQHYNQHLAIIAANKTASDENSLVELGKLLVAANQIPAAHTAFVLAGSALQYALPPGPELFSLVGATATTGLHGFSSVPAILRTEIYSWLQTNGEFFSYCFSFFQQNHNSQSVFFLQASRSRFLDSYQCCHIN